MPNKALVDEGYDKLLMRDPDQTLSRFEERNHNPRVGGSSPFTASRKSCPNFQELADLDVSVHEGPQIHRERL